MALLSTFSISGTPARENAQQVKGPEQNLVDLPQYPPLLPVADPWQRNLKCAQASEVPVIDNLGARPVAARFLEMIPIGYARRHCVLGITGPASEMIVVVSDITAGFHEVDTLGRLLNEPVTIAIAPRDELNRAINVAYQQRTGQTDALIATLDRRDVLSEVQQMIGREDLLDVETRAPVIKLVNLILFEAVKMLASDVHIQPYEDRLVIRLRIDGVLFDHFEIPSALLNEIVSRVKVMGRMNIAEKRLPQDGRATAQVGDRMIDLRISSVPTSFGERIVIRLLDKSVRLYTLNELGMDASIRPQFEEMIGIEHGLVLVTGPTGSGKSTTLYAALQQIDTSQNNVMTLEDPIEYQLPGISQMQVSEKKGMTFARGLRSVLRQDPDIIMVGEIRDHDTAVMAIQSALTGHLVFSTLHTNDAPSAVTRLLDLSIEPYLVASSVVGVVAQRLVRTVCGSCAASHTPELSELKRLDLTPDSHVVHGMRKGKGCPACRHTGFRGRDGIFELMPIHDQIRLLIQSRSNASEIKVAAVRSGMKTLRDQGVAKVLSGRTTIDEIVRVTMRSTH